MTIWSEENAKRILDRLCEHPSVTAASKLVGGSSKIVWVWAGLSAKDKAQNIADSKFFILGWPDPDCPPIWFHDAIELSRRIHALNLDADTRELLGGVEKPVIEGGSFQYVKDSLALAKYPDAKTAADLGGLPDWPYAHDERGARIVLTVKEHVPAQLKIHALKSLMGQIWNPPERTQSEVKHSGFMIIGKNKTPERQSTPLREALEERLRRLRAARDGERTTTPNHPVRIEGRGSTNDPREQISAGLSDDVRPAQPQPQPQPAPAPAPRPDYSRPAPSLNQENRSRMPPGGFSTRTGKPT